MRVVCISDIHGQMANFDDPPLGDILIVAGDISATGNRLSVLRVLDYISTLDFKHKIVIAGNHDEYIQKVGKGGFRFSDLPDGVTYLEDDGIEVMGLKIWGTPWSKLYGDWAFMDTEEVLDEHFAKIPNDIDILVVHGPPLGVLDKVARGNEGSPALREAILNRQPRYAIFGHIHEDGGGRDMLGTTQCHNVAALTENYRLRQHHWTEIFIDPRES